MKSRLSVLLSIVIVICSISCFSFTGFAVTGEGTSENPYVIADQNDYANISVNGLDKYYVLKSDITLTNHTPISNFNGKFNGNGYTVKITGNGGLFASTLSSSVVENVVVEGTISGTAAISAVNSGSIINCINNAAVSGGAKVGGIAGESLSGRIEGCINNGNVSGTSWLVGGIVGYSGCSIKNCANTGEVSSSYYAGSVGGIAGQHSSASAVVENCYNVGKVSINDKNTVAGGVGGIIGQTADKKTQIKNCFNAGTVSIRSGVMVGGIVGYVGSASVASEDLANVITACYNIGEILAVDTGKNYTSDKAIYGSYNEASAFGPTAVDCFYLGEASSVAVAGITSKTASELADKKTFSSWDFENTWEIGKIGYSYPVLKDVEFLLVKGTELNPYVITGKADYDRIKINGLDKYYILKSDIELTNHTPIADFAGTFDGCGYTVTINGTNGLFYSTMAGSTVKNVTVDGTIENTAAYTGGIAGICKGVISNCINKASVTGTQRIGGISGQTESSARIEKAINEGDILSKGSNWLVGGIVGYSQAPIYECGNAGDVTSEYYSGNVGGIAGQHNSVSATIEKCYNTGNVSITHSNSVGGGVGGIAGQIAEKKTQIINCFNAGNVHIKAGEMVGGILGYISSGSVSSEDQANIIKNCYNVGKISVLTKDTSDTKGIYGLYNEQSTYGPKTVDCYYLGNAQSPAISGITASDEDAMASEETYAEGWLFDDVWFMGFETYKYPVLSGVEFIAQEGSYIRPIAISNKNEFTRIDGSDKAYILTEDIDLTDVDYSPITFAGSLDGDGHSIEVAIVSEGKGNVGLFSELSGNITIKNLILNGTIDVSAGGNRCYGIGALAGSTQESTSGIIKDCVSNVVITNSDCDYVGGFIGRCYGNHVSIVLENLVNNGDIILGDGEEVSSNNTGGIAGVLASDSVIRNCVNNGELAGGHIVGGICGNLYGDIYTSVNNGDITVHSYAGGISGYLATTSPVISDSYNTGDVSAISSTDENKLYIGGIAGVDMGGNAEITNCYSIGAVINMDENYLELCGIIGDYPHSGNDALITNCYYLSDSENESAKSIDEFKSLAASLGDAYKDSESFPQLKVLNNSKLSELSYVKISAAAENAGITVNKEYAKVGSEVILSVVANEGYKVASVKVDGENVTGENGKYNFVAKAEGNSVEILLESSLNKPSVTLKVFSGDKLAAVELAKYGIEDPLKYLGKKAIVVLMETEGESLTEAGLVVGEKTIDITEKVSQNKSNVFMLYGAGVAGESVNVKGYAKNEAGETETEVLVAPLREVVFH